MSKKVYFDVLDDIVDKHNDTQHETIKMKHIDVKSDSYDEHNVDSNAKDAKFKIRNHVKIQITKTYTPNWSEGVSVIIKFKNTVPLTYVMKNLLWRRTYNRKSNQKRRWAMC